ncbi:MAG: GNAT family N-acetyltransferase [Pirellulaceae bacterium]|nr:GNAT family N-acetyltransferase [Pirellulaceae bacterium]
MGSHARAKYLGFWDSIDREVFPCLAVEEGCWQLMWEISQRASFLPGATWLLQSFDSKRQRYSSCGTIQGLEKDGLGAFQNIAISPEHRNKGLGELLIRYALGGFSLAGLSKAYLEVTAENRGAVALYRRLGFDVTEEFFLERPSLNSNHPRQGSPKSAIS